MRSWYLTGVLLLVACGGAGFETDDLALDSDVKMEQEEAIGDAQASQALGAGGAHPIEKPETTDLEELGAAGEGPEPSSAVPPEPVVWPAYSDQRGPASVCSDKLRPKVEGCMSCGDVQRFAVVATDAIQRVRIEDAMYCQTDNDCTFVGSRIGCQSGCGVLISRHHAKGYIESFRKLDETLCEGYVAADCEESENVCPPYQARCVANRCEEVPG